jgi:hypothetical protein
MAKPCAANQESTRDATWDIRAGLLSLERSAGRHSRSVLGERPEDFGTTTVWSTLVCTESDFSRERDCLAEMAANLKTMAAAIMEMAHTAAQKAVQDRLMAARFTIEGVRTRGTCWNSVSFDWRTPADINVNVWSWTSGSTQPGSRRGNGGHGRSSGPCEVEAKNLRSEMRAEAINMGGFTFVLLVGTRD